jgi:hypothetical protein
MQKTGNYTCRDYREEMQLLGLKKRLQEKDLNAAERAAIETEIEKLEKALKMD